MENIETLSASNNKIEIIPFDWAQKMNSLMHFDISKNKIETILE